MLVKVYQHGNTREAVGSEVLPRVRQLLEDCDVALRPGAATTVRKVFLEGLRGAGWTDRVRIDRRCNLTVTAMMGTVALCLQTGNMARMYADLMKLQLAYLDGNITVAALVVPTSTAGAVLGSNIASYERLTRELEVFRSIVTVPLVVFGFEQTDKSNTP